MFNVHGHIQRGCHGCKCTVDLHKIFKIPRENQLTSFLPFILIEKNFCNRYMYLYMETKMSIFYFQIEFTKTSPCQLSPDKADETSSESSQIIFYICVLSIQNPLFNKVLNFFNSQSVHVNTTFKLL